MTGFRFVERLSDAHLGDLLRLYQNEWWTQGRTKDEVERLVRGSTHVFGLVDEASGELAAFARVLSDGAAKALVFDVIVDDARRGRALGRALMEKVLGHPSLAPVEHVELYCLPEVVPFYRRFGFTEDVGGVLLMRRPSRLTNNI